MTRLPALLKSLPLQGILRIDVGLEGDWSGSVVTVWRREGGFCGFDEVAGAHPVHRPSAELYFEGAWFGLHCFRIEGGQHVFDEGFVLDLMRHVERALESSG